MSGRRQEPPKTVIFRFGYLEGTKPRVANPRVGSGTGFGGPGGGSGGPGGGFVIVVKVMAKPLPQFLRKC